VIKLISFIVFTIFSISKNLKFEGNQVNFFKLNQQYFFTVYHKLSYLWVITINIYSKLPN